MAILLFVSVKMSRSGLKWCEKYLPFYCCFLFSHPSSSQIYQLGWNSNKSAVNVTNKRFCRVTLILGTTQRPATLYLDLSLLILPRYIFLFQSRAHCKCYQLFDICNIWIAYINWVLYDTIFFLSNLKECHQFSSLVISYWMFFFFSIHLQFRNFIVETWWIASTPLTRWGVLPRYYTRCFVLISYSLLKDYYYYFFCIWIILSILSFFSGEYCMWKMHKRFLQRFSLSLVF